MSKLLLQQHASHFKSLVDAIFGGLYSDIHVPRYDSLRGKRALVTGANTGVGFDVALALASRDAEVYLLCRNKSKAENARDEIIDKTKNSHVFVEVIDFEEMSSVREFIDRWHKRPDESRRIDIIVNNAGAIVERRTITSSGLEKTYQINHLGPFLLTLSLIQSAYITPTARIVMVSSNQIYASDRLTLDLLNSPDIVGKVEIGQPLNLIDAMRTYARSKAMQHVFTIELQRRLEISGTWRNVTVHCCHPGTVKSSIWEGLERTFLTNIAARIAFATGITPEQGATTPVWLATAPEPAHEDLRGRYWARCRWRWIPAWMHNKQTTVALWEQWCRDAGIENPL